MRNHRPVTRIRPASASAKRPAIGRPRRTHNLVILSFVHPLALLDKTTTPQTAERPAHRHDAGHRELLPLTRHPRHALDRRHHVRTPWDQRAGAERAAARAQRRRRWRRAWASASRSTTKATRRRASTPCRASSTPIAPSCPTTLRAPIPRRASPSISRRGTAGSSTSPSAPRVCGSIPPIRCSTTPTPWCLRNSRPSQTPRRPPTGRSTWTERRNTIRPSFRSHPASSRAACS